MEPRAAASASRGSRSSAGPPLVPSRRPQSGRDADTQLGVFAAFDPKLSEHHRERPTASSPTSIRSCNQVLDQVKHPKLVAMDTMNLWINGSEA
jgi:hypothetical protein